MRQESLDTLHLQHRRYMSSALVRQSRTSNVRRMYLRHLPVKVRWVKCSTCIKIDQTVFCVFLHYSSLFFHSGRDRLCDGISSFLRRLVLQCHHIVRRVLFRGIVFSDCTLERLQSRL